MEQNYLYDYQEFVLYNISLLDIFLSSYVLVLICYSFVEYTLSLYEVFIGNLML